jgi:cell division protein FtsQ
MREEEIIDEKQASPGQYSRSAYVIFAALVLLIGVTWYGSLQWKERLLVTDLVIDGESVVPRDEIVSLAQVPPHARLFDVDLAAVARSVRSNNFVRQVVVRREPPALLRVTVIERVPVAYVATPGMTELLLVDDEGYILPHVSAQAIFDVPVVTGVEPALFDSVGIRTSSVALRCALEVLRVGRSMNGELTRLISEVDVTDVQELILFSSDSAVPIRFGSGDVAEKIVKLDGFWKSVVMREGIQNIRAIDLRFRDQVIVVRAPEPSSTEKKV